MLTKKQLSELNKALALMESVNSELDYSFEFDMYQELSAVIADFKNFLEIRNKSKQ
jgi:hypothetical protein